MLGKQANRQLLFSLTLPRKEVPIPITLWLCLPENWTQGPLRRAAARFTESIAFATREETALGQIDAALADGVRFGMVLANARFGSSAAFRAGLMQRDPRWSVAVQPSKKAYPADVQLCVAAIPALGRPAKHPGFSVPNVSVVLLIESLGRATHTVLPSLLSVTRPDPYPQRPNDRAILRRFN